MTGAMLVLCLLIPAVQATESDKIELRLWNLPDLSSASPFSQAAARVIEQYRKQHPEVILRKTSGIRIPQIGGSASILMAIAGGIAPDVLDCPVGGIHNYVEQNFLVPLDEYVAGIPTEAMHDRAPENVWDAARLGGPDGKEHLYAVPTGFDVATLKVRHDLAAKFGYPKERMPATWDE